MSEKEFFKRFWLQVAAGVAILIIAGVGSLFVARAQTHANTKAIEQIKTEQRQFATKEAVNENHKDIKDFYEKVDEIKDLILELHAK